MAQAKYLRFYELMTERHAELFDKFQKIHDQYTLDTQKWEGEFHAVGRDVLDVVRDWERRLCAGMERGTNAVYSQGLSEKFWGEVKKRFALIEEVGLRRR